MNAFIKLFAFISLTACLFLTGCLEVEEKTFFKTAEAGEYSLSFDMGKLMAQAKLMGAADQLNEMQNSDTTILLKDFISIDNTLTEQEKQLVVNGKVITEINAGNGNMKLSIKAPFNNLAQLTMLRSTLFKMMENGIKPGLKSIETITQNAGDLAIINLSNLGYNVQISKGSIAQTVTNATQLQIALNSDSTLMQIKQLAPFMGSSILFKNAYTFTTPIKNVKAANSTLSADNKTVIINNELNDLFDNPRAFEFSITY